MVDDEPVNLQVAANVPTMGKIGFTLAAGGLQALEMVGNGAHFALVLLDIMMPIYSMRHRPLWLRSMRARKLLLPIVGSRNVQGIPGTRPGRIA